MNTIPYWNLENEKLVRTFLFSDFKEAMHFVNKIALLAEQEEHHPDIFIHWNEVTLTLFTHDINGISEKDYTLAKKINLL
ncbi:MAG: 4a-hydroxytetrahydrobiopterin dehydratase [Candidatus Nanoarchaeia archaeon]